MDYTALIGLGLQFLTSFLASTKSTLPAEVATALENAVTAVAAHHADLLTKDALEAQRG